MFKKGFMALGNICQLHHTNLMSCVALFVKGKKMRKNVGSCQTFDREFQTYKSESKNKGNIHIEQHSKKIARH